MATLALALAALVPPALATSTHEEYVAQVNPICKSAADQARKKLTSLKSTGDPFADSLRRARLYGRLLSKAIRHIATVEPAPGEAAAVSAWLDEGRRTVRLIKQLLRLSKGPDARKFRVLSKQIERSQRLAAARASALGLQACAQGGTPN